MLIQLRLLLLKGIFAFSVMIYISMWILHVIHECSKFDAMAYNVYDWLD